MKFSDWHTFELRSSWEIDNGWARPLGTPYVRREPYVSSTTLVRASPQHYRADPLALAKAELKRRMEHRVMTGSLRRANRGVR